MVAICGTGMGAMAGLLKEAGHEVSGSDRAFYPPMAERLQAWGIPTRQGFDPAHIDSDTDLVIVGNVCRKDNLEAQAALQRGFRVMSFPQALSEFFIAGKASVVVAGTHGKTTTAALLSYLLMEAGLDPSFLVGGIPQNFGKSFHLGKGGVFVVEGDEYDTAFFDKGPKFLHYRPQALLLTAVEFDHADIYRDLDDVKGAFRRLVELLPPDAPLVVAADFPHAREVTRSRDACLTFGVSPDAEWRAANVHDDGTATVFDIVYRGRVQSTARIPQPGAINARNALGVFVTARALGLATSEILPGLASFRGVARRQELVGEFHGVTVIDDFAHHPTAVAGAIAAVRLRYPRRRLWAVFEPRSNTSRRKVFQREYVAALEAADQVVIGGVFQKATDAVSAAELFSPDQLAADLAARGVAAHAGGDADAIRTLLLNDVRRDDVILLMSNGDFGGLRRTLVDGLVARA